MIHEADERGGSLNQLASQVVDSLNRLADGIAVPDRASGHENRMLCCLATEFFGDWKWHRDSWLHYLGILSI